ncbi:spore coat assembly protein ExsA-like isoform X1 [Haliotis rubra]|uniref:spore coat assembly protein ExsA-like isoform X1 n=1 Tax=Haliotis rubra TaxID=36100 RepID=UPI001EE5E240|nr:spore coat assembly protein ExsA-like isoform X1 [Haliotis rubra]
MNNSLPDSDDILPSNRLLMNNNLPHSDDILPSNRLPMNNSLPHSDDILPSNRLPMNNSLPHSNYILPSNSLLMNNNLPHNDDILPSNSLLMNNNLPHSDCIPPSNRLPMKNSLPYSDDILPSNRFPMNNSLPHSDDILPSNSLLMNNNLPHSDDILPSNSLLMNNNLPHSDDILPSNRILTSNNLVQAYHSNDLLKATNAKLVPQQSPSRQQQLFVQQRPLYPIGTISCLYVIIYGRNAKLCLRVVSAICKFKTPVVRVGGLHSVALLLLLHQPAGFRSFVVVHVVPLLYILLSSCTYPCFTHGGAVHNLTDQLEGSDSACSGSHFCLARGCQWLPRWSGPREDLKTSKQEAL